MMGISAEDKNYFRVLLKDVATNKLDRPIVLAGKYQYDTRYEYATFTNVRILLNPPYSKTKIICNHLNILKKEIAKYFTLDEQFNKKKCFFVGYPVEYMTNGDVRYGFKLSNEVSFVPFGVLSNRYLYDESIKNECFELEEWVQNNMTGANIGLRRKREINIIKRI